jgi:hypothetical protein
MACGVRCEGTNCGSMLKSIEERKRPMVLIYESDPLDDEHARGNFYHVCRGRIDRTPISVPPPEQPYECPHCGLDLEAEDFWMAMQKGSV